MAFEGIDPVSQLLQQYHNLLQEFAWGNNVDTVFLDFTKAFDKVDHGVLLHKLRNIRITGKMGPWIHSFLTDRLQIVVANGKHSLPSKVEWCIQGISIRVPSFHYTHEGH